MYAKVMSVFYARPYKKKGIARLRATPSTEKMAEKDYFVPFGHFFIFSTQVPLYGG